MSHETVSPPDAAASATVPARRLARRGWVVGALALTALTLASGVTGEHGHASWQPSCADGGRRAA